MAEINFGLLDTQLPGRIATIPLQAQEAGQANALRTMQMMQGMQQNEASQMQLQKLRREQNTLNQIQAAIVGSGGPPDLKAAADAMMRSGDIEHVKLAQSIYTGLRNQTEAAAYRTRYMGPDVAPAPGVQPAVPPGNALPGAAQPTQRNALPGITQGGAPGVASGVADPSAALNARIKALERQYLSIGNNPELQSDKPLLLEQIKDVQRQLRDASVVSPDVKLMQQLNLPVTQDGFAKLNELKRDPGEFERMLRSMDLPPLEERALRAQWLKTKSTHAAGATVVMPPLEKSEQQEKGKLNVKLYGEIAGTADRARKILPALETSQSILDNGFRTGFGADAQTQATRVLGALGVPEADKYATNSQLFLAQGRQALLQRQLEQKGAQSEGDAQRINQTFIQLGNTPEANKFLVATAKAQAKQDIERQKFYGGWWAKNKTYEGAEESWLDGAGGKSLFDSPGMKSYAPKAPQTDVRSRADAIIQGNK